MKIGPIEVNFLKPGQKSYSDLVAIMNREKAADRSNLKIGTRGQLQEYRSWVYSCVSLISDRVSTVPFRFYNKTTNAELNTASKNFGVFTKVFYRPNDLMSFRFLKSFCQLQLDLCGMTCILKVRNRLGQIWELWPFNMNDLHTIDVDSSDYINPKVNFVFNINNKLWKFDLKDIICIYYPHPTSMWEPQSPIQAHAYAVDIDSYVEVYERDFFKNSARVDMILTTDSQLDEPKANELKARWKAKFSGNFHDIAILDSGLKPEPIKFTNKDFEFLNLAQWSKDKILSAYRIPPAKLGGTGNNRAESVTADISFNRESIQPRLSLWDEELSIEILQDFNPNYIIRHDNPIPRDRDLETKEAKSFVGVPVLTINEYRKDWQNLEPIDGGDDILIPSGFIPLKKLDKYLENQMAKPPQDNDDRHDDDDPKVNPDGTDDRDDNPTDGRALPSGGASLKQFHSLETRARVLWNKFLFDSFCKTNEDQFKNDIFKVLNEELIPATIESLLDHFGCREIKVDYEDWIIPTSENTAKHYHEALFKFSAKKDDDWKGFIKEQFNSSSRISKITNSLLRACINYSKWLVMTSKNQERIWQVNSNECGHRGRLNKNISNDVFGIGSTNVRFPGDKIMNFHCDCTIVPNGYGD